MIFETKYRKRALEAWEKSREETKNEVIQDVKDKLTVVRLLHHMLKSIFVHKKSIQ